MKVLKVLILERTDLIAMKINKKAKKVTLSDFKGVNHDVNKADMVFFEGVLIQSRY